MSEKFGAGNEIRTRDPDLGKVVLYQLSYSRAIEFSIMFSLVPHWQSASRKEALILMRKL